MKKQLAVLAGGALFGFGLAWSRMTQPEVVLSFLNLRDLGLLLVLGGAVVVTTLAYQLVPRWRSRPVLAGAFEERQEKLDWRTVTGAAIFGIGWGLSGLCPGSAIASLGSGNYPILLGLAGILAGAYVQARVPITGK